MRPMLFELLALCLVAPPGAESLADQLHDAARRGDTRAVQALLDRGADVNARTRFGATALWLAVYKNRPEVVKLLLARKADPDIADTVWGLAPLALAGEEVSLLRLLLRARAKGADALLLHAANAGQADRLRAVLDEHKPAAGTLSAALLLAGKDEVKKLLQKAGATPLPSPGAEQRKRLEVLAGSYESPGGARFTVALRGGVLVASSPLGALYVLREAGGTTFRPIGADGVQLAFEVAGGKGVRVTLKDTSGENAFERSAAQAAERPGPYRDEPAVVRAPRPWPTFRGENASGIADGQHPPAVWDAKKTHAGMWKTPIPGLGHSCPVVWGDRLFVTTAVSSNPKSELRTGLYGDVSSAKDRSKHSFRVYCLDRRTGKVLWEREAAAGVPKVRRHPKATHANATPATDGKVLIVSFASEGLYAYAFDGALLWKRDLGMLDAGAFMDPETQWESASSPILYRGTVIVQCDRQKDSYLAAFDAATGKPVWRTPRDEPPSWGTPTVIESKTPSGPRAELVTNGTTAVRGYDPLTGKELWRLEKSSQITVPTPIFGDGLIFVASGYRPIQPIYALWPGARGEITPKDREEASAAIAWSKMRGGPYMPTPIHYRGHLYCCSNAGLVTCHEARTGRLVYRKRLGGTEGYTASPVAADGRLYFTGEDGKVRVVQAGPEYRLLAVSDLRETCLATPAICDGTIFFRTKGHVVAIGRDPERKVPAR
jgi:outer membrane protein assembly factor BamB